MSVVVLTGICPVVKNLQLYTPRMLFFF